MKRREFLGSAALALAAGRAGGAAEPGRLRAVRDGGVLRVLDGEHPVLEYRHAPTAGPEGTGPLFTRSGYVHPLHAPNGAKVTDDFPADHPHQRGLFFAWTKTELTLDGTVFHPDFWNLGSGTGRIRSVHCGVREAPAGGCRWSSEHAWEAKVGDDWKQVLHETWSASVLPPLFAEGERDAASSAYVFDLVCIQEPKVDLLLPQYRYGGISIRGAREWIPGNSGMRYLTSEGKTLKDAEGSTARWIDMAGPLGGKTAGVALLEHPENLRAPNQLRVPPENPYYVYSPSKSGDLTLRAGEAHRFRYRVVVHNGSTDSELLNRLWRELAGA
ncbi:MAG: PmoA family protein [Armatimonadota bacterium]